MRYAWWTSSHDIQAYTHKFYTRFLHRYVRSEFREVNRPMRWTKGWERVIKFYQVRRTFDGAHARDAGCLGVADWYISGGAAEVTWCGWIMTYREGSQRLITCRESRFFLWSWRDSTHELRPVILKNIISALSFGFNCFHSQYNLAANSKFP